MQLCELINAYDSTVSSLFIFRKITLHIFWSKRGRINHLTKWFNVLKKTQLKSQRALEAAGKFNSVRSFCMQKEKSYAVLSRLWHFLKHKSEKRAKKTKS